MQTKKGFTVVEILVVIVILAVVGLVIMVSVIPRIERNAIEAFVNDGKLYLQAANKYYTDKKIEDEKTESTICVSIKDLNKTGVKVSSNDYEGYINITTDKDKKISYEIALTNKRFYTFNRLTHNYLVNSDSFDDDSVLDNYDSISKFPTKCP